MYTKHHTKALVLSAYDSGEADKVFSLLTPDFGKVYAKARGVRLHGARHKGALQLLSEAHVSLVRGKSGWRITNVTGERNLFAELSGDRARFIIFVRVVRLMRRLVAGEGHAEKVFSVVAAFAGALTRESLSREALSSAETLAVIRLLSVLGYLKDDARLAPFLSDPEDFSGETLRAFSPEARDAVRAANASLEASHL